MATTTGFKANKGRRPYPIGTLIEVIYRDTSMAICSCGEERSTDWKLDGVDGDILFYRKVEVQNEV